MISGKNPGLLVLLLCACGIGQTALAQMTPTPRFDPLYAQHLIPPVVPPTFSPPRPTQNPMPQPPAREPVDCKLEKNRLNCESQNPKP